MLHIHSICVRIWKGHQPKYVILIVSEHLLVYFFNYIFTRNQELTFDWKQQVNKKKNNFDYG